MNSSNISDIKVGDKTASKNKGKNHAIHGEQMKSSFFMEVQKNP